MSQVTKSVNGYHAHLDSYCINCNSLIDKVTRNQRFCSTKWGKNCSREFRLKVDEKIKEFPKPQRAAKRWQLYNPLLLKKIRQRYDEKNYLKRKQSRSIIARRHKLIKKVMKMDFMPVLVRGKAI